ncbi:conjugal transfer protein TrbI [Scytonema hofmannii FACHB-248]|uniref:Conjugal transfer protein TrbI n=1 Tax=Scytonema hofmannii FACHB-248 TaxID=1842502 RepID=A0ABR8GMX1_9CYAN|nr:MULTISPECIES: TrbI/VirB10 family protein [Nostocales]MBD2604766.1 conjugal transfer protein TrbI [Scytonema hofmannii FACHB-248]
MDKELNETASFMPQDDQLDSEWDEAKLAQLIGFDDFNGNETTGKISKDINNSFTEGENIGLSDDLSQNVIAQSELFDDPQTGKTQPTLSGNPFAKSGVVGLGMLAVFGSGAIFLNTIMGSKPKSAPSMVTVSKPEIQATKVETQEAETGKFKAQLALGSQAEKIKSVEQSKSPKTTVVEKPTNKPSSATAPVPRPVVNKSQTVPPVRYISRPPQPVRQPLRLPVQQSVQQPLRLPVQQPIQQPVRQALASFPTVRETPKSNTSASNSKPVDPMEQWLAMSRLGSYGGVQTSEFTTSASKEIQQPSVSAMPAVGGAIAENGASLSMAETLRERDATDVPIARLASANTEYPPSEQSSEQLGSSKLDPRAHSPIARGLPPGGLRQSSVAPEAIAQVKNSQTTSDQVTIPRATLVRAISDGVVAPQNPQAEEEVVAAQVNPAEEAALLTGVPVRRLTVGGQSQGQLVTPVIWADSKSNTVATKSDRKSEKFIVQLAEPITDEEGFVTLPAGTTIVAKVVDINDSGLAQMEATQVVIDGQEYVLPPGAISIRGTKGQPLIASKWGNKGSAIASHDATAFLFGSLAKVGEVMNRPDFESSASTSGFNFSTSTTTRNSSPNLLGAVLEGGFAPLTKQILQRNQRDLQEILQRQDVWYVRAGTNVQVFINQSFEF